ncbi:3',5'-cyclic-nucleotide phosphodiesterase [Methylobacterium sp. WL6]|uniref:3',5'-cyclic-nucleotide phosphodiesterase n=1 Tax=Methylobacterium sp. WL6 TaxID=2603901 RepID=UPI0011CAE921|nr:3',5'-cyclic-nucleotide phosphodiesterase [Methylobacterium sp. WL6]TXN62279.1 3',5'-cyclic-nucleotide phosphodiesterase [Methylobacterium sp. WL6]
MNSLRILALAALVAVPTVTAEARDLGVSEEALRSACTGDYLRLCAGIDPNGDHVEACFRAKMAKVSPGCRSAIALYRVRETTTERRAQQAEDRRP